MSYATYSNAELRRVLLASPQDEAAAAEATARILAGVGDEFDIDAAQDRGYDEGYDAGHDDGYAEGLADGQLLD